MMSSSKASASDKPSVQPSATLIEALHRKLCDPSIVSSYERCRPPHVTQRLITHRWILKSEDENKNDRGTDCEATKTSSIDETAEKSDTENYPSIADDAHKTNNERIMYNTVPKRNYLDIRIEQNKMFGNEQYLRSQKKLAALSSTSPKSVEAINVNKKQIQKVIDSIQNHVNEGLAACPDHNGLKKVECEVKTWLDRLNGVDATNRSTASSAVMLDTPKAASLPRKGRRNNNTTTIIDLTNDSDTQHIEVKRKGGEGRVQAAIDDALVEKMFLQGGSDNRNNFGAVERDIDDASERNNVGDLGNERLDECNHYERRHERHLDSDHYYDGKNYYTEHERGRRRHYHSRSRSRSPKRERYRRKGERRHRHRSKDARRRSKRRLRSRSRSLSQHSPSSRASHVNQSDHQSDSNENYDTIESKLEDHNASDGSMSEVKRKEIASEKGKGETDSHRRQGRRTSHHQSRSRSPMQGEKQRQKGDRKRRRRSRDERKRRKRRHRPRSRSLSTSSSDASLSSRSISEERPKRKYRKERHKHKSKHKRKSRRRERKRSSGRNRRRGHSRSVSSSLCLSAAGAEDVKSRHELSPSFPLPMQGENDRAISSPK